MRVIGFSPMTKLLWSPCTCQLINHYFWYTGTKNRIDILDLFDDVSMCIAYLRTVIQPTIFMKIGSKFWL